MQSTRSRLRSVLSLVPVLIVLLILSLGLPESSSGQDVTGLAAAAESGAAEPARVPEAGGSVRPASGEQTEQQGPLEDTESTDGSTRLRPRGFTILRAPQQSVPARQDPRSAPLNEAGGGWGAAAPAARVPADATSASTAAAVQAESSPEAVPEAEVGIAARTAQIQQRIEQIQAAEGLAEDVRAEAIKRFQQALDFLKLAADAERRQQTLQAEIAQAPQRLAELKAQLESKETLPAPQIDPSATLSQLEQQQTVAIAQEENARQQLDKFLAASKQRAERKAKLPQLLEQLSEQKEEVQSSLGAASEGEHALIREARTAELTARAALLDRQGPVMQLELLSAESLDELSTLRGDLLQRQLKRAEKQATAWRQLVTTFRKQEAERKAREARRNVANAHPALKALAEENAELAEQRVALSQTIGQSTEQIETLEQELERIENEFQEVTQKEETVGLTRAVGLTLRQQREKLPELSTLQDQLALIEAEIPRCQMQVLSLKNERAELTDLEAVQEAILEELDIDAARAATVNVPEMVREMLEAKRTYLTDLLKDYESYQHLLTDLDFNARRLITQTQEYESYIDKHVLWIRSTDVLNRADFDEAGAALQALSDPQHWSELAAGVVVSVEQRPLEIALASLICLLIVVYRHQIRRHLRQRSERLARSREGELQGILKALLLSVLSASLWPAMLGVAAWWLMSIEQGSAFSDAVASGLTATATAYWTLSVARELCRPEGLGEVHFHWPPKATQVVYRNLYWTTLSGLPLVFLVVLIDAHHLPEWSDSLGRILFIFGMLLLAAFFARTLYQGQALIRHVVKASDSGALHRLRFLWYLIGVGTPVAFAALAVAGYYYTVEQLTGRLVTTAWLAILLLMAQALLSRWIEQVRARLESRRVAARELASAPAGRSAAELLPPSPAVAGDADRDADRNTQASDERPAAMQTVTELQETAPRDEQPVLPVHDYDFTRITRQMHRLLHGLTSLCFLAGCWLIWANVLPALGILDRFELWENTVRVAETVETAEGVTSTQMVDRIEATTLSHLLIAGGILAVTVFAGRNLPGLLEVALLQRLPLDQGGRHAVTTICRYALTLVGVILACRLMGIRWSSVQWLVAAMTVGLGFGLQEIFANLVSGLILLIERPLRIGDLVTVGSITGTVTKMHIRATTVTDPDRRELVVPNKRFITDDFVNWTLSDPVTRVVFPVGIAYGSDTALAHRLLMKVAAEHPLVLEEPAPSAIFSGFGDSTLDFQLRVFIPRRDCYTVVVHELNSAIDREFAAAEIEIAFPQRDLNIRSVEGLSHLMPKGTANEAPDAASQSTDTGQRNAA